jgi:hypothetical protein
MRFHITVMSMNQYFRGTYFFHQGSYPDDGGYASHTHKTFLGRRQEDKDSDQNGIKHCSRCNLLFNSS